MTDDELRDIVRKALPRPAYIEGGTGVHVSGIDIAIARAAYAAAVAATAELCAVAIEARWPADEEVMYREVYEAALCAAACRDIARGA